LKNNFTPYIYIVFFLLLKTNICAQETELEINSSSPSNQNIIDSYYYKKKHPSKEDALIELTRYSNNLKNEGYFTNTLDSIIYKKKTLTAHYSLGIKTDSITITENNRQITIAIHKISKYLKRKTDNLNSKGMVFSETKLSNLHYKNNRLYAILQTEYSKKRNIDKFIIEGYRSFSLSYLNKYLKHLKTPYLTETNKNISEKISQLDFLSEIKNPETLFTKDSTIVYLFLEKKQRNELDANIMYNSSSESKLNGHINLVLKNSFNKGESFELKWNKTNNSSTDFKTSIHLPYLFRTPISIKTDFNLFKQDSTFLNSNLKIKASYPIQKNSTLSFYFDTTTSSSNSQNPLNSDLSNSFIGALYNLHKPSNSALYNRRFSITLGATVGKRKIISSKEKQQKLEGEIILNVRTSTRSYLYIRNKSELLFSKKYFQNELLRIGGLESIRGYNDQSVFTNKYSYVNVEYRYVTNTRNYLYSILDYGFYRNPFLNNSNSLVGLGFGYSFLLKNNLIDIAYTTAKNENKNFAISNSKLSIQWKLIF